MRRLLLLVLAAMTAAACTGAAPARTPVPPGTIQSVTPDPVATPRPATPAPLPKDPADLLEELVRRQFAGKNNMDDPFLRRVTVTPQAGGSFAVVLDFNASDNLTMGFIRGGIENEMEEAYVALYSSGVKVRRVRIGAYFPLTDDGGNTEHGLVYRTTIDAKQAKKINWDRPGAVNWRKSWTTDRIHPELKAAD